MSVFSPKTISLRDGAVVNLRSPEVDDAQALLEYIDAVRHETDGIGFSVGDELLSIEKERDWIKGVIDDPRGVQILAEMDGVIVALCGLHGNRLIKLQHRAGLGISIRAAWCDRGLGRQLMRELIAWAEDHPDLKLLQLSVHANNPRARHLYASLGFEIEGRRRGGIRIGDEFVDEIVMSRWLGEDESPELISGHNRVATK